MLRAVSDRLRPLHRNGFEGLRHQLVVVAVGAVDRASASTVICTGATTGLSAAAAQDGFGGEFLFGRRLGQIANLYHEFIDQIAGLPSL
jgi:hypothetical protein